MIGSVLPLADERELGLTAEMAVVEGEPEARGSKDPNALCWPPLRSDLVAIACFFVVGCCLALQRWQLLAGAALCAGVMAGLAPRMTGEFVLRIWGNEARGVFRRPGKT